MSAVADLFLVRESALRRIFPGYRVGSLNTWHEARGSAVWADGDAITIVNDPHTHVLLADLRAGEFTRVRG